MPNGGASTKEIIKRKPKQSRAGFTASPVYEHFFVDEVKHPYNEVRRFDWIRGYHVGGVP